MTFKCLCCVNSRDYFDFWPLRLNSNCFSIFLVTYLNIPYVPCFHTAACEPCWAISANSYQMGRLVSHITEQNNLPATHARVTGAERPQTVSHLETPIMCSALWPHPNHHLFPSSQIPDMPLQFSPPGTRPQGLSRCLLWVHHHQHPFHAVPVLVSLC